VSIIVIANKADKIDTNEAEVSETDMQKFTQETGIRIYPASAKSGKNVESSFLLLTGDLIDK